MNIIGQNIKKLRQAKSFNQTQVADLLKISTPAFSKIETGITDPNISRLNQIALLFGVPVSQLLEDPEEPQRKEMQQNESALTDRLNEQRELVLGLQQKLITLYEENRNLRGL